MAPLQQLVTQQMEACYEIMGIPKVNHISFKYKCVNKVTGGHSRDDWKQNIPQGQKGRVEFKTCFVCDPPDIEE